MGTVKHTEKLEQKSKELRLNIAAIVVGNGIKCHVM